jgi:hypothetical protein
VKSLSDSGKKVEVNVPPGRIKIIGANAYADIFAPLPDDDPIHALVGKIASEMARFERILDLMIWSIDPNGQSTTKSLRGVAARIKKLAALMATRGSSAQLNSRNFRSR